MVFIETPLPGAYIIEIEPMSDERGFFARNFCRHEFIAHGLNPDLVQCSISFNRNKGTLRGMHYQEHPYSEVKLVRCSRGAIYDVILDIRPDSPTFKKWFAAELIAPGSVRAEDHARLQDFYRMLYIPEGFAHGFQTLIGDTEVIYQMSEYYHPEAARGILWNDPAFEISWPLANPVMSMKDETYPLYEAGGEK